MASETIDELGMITSYLRWRLCAAMSTIDRVSHPDLPLISSMFHVFVFPALHVSEFLMQEVGVGERRLLLAVRRMLWRRRAL